MPLKREASSSDAIYMALLRRIGFKVEIENEALLLCAIVFMVNLERPPAPGSVPTHTQGNCALLKRPVDLAFMRLEPSVVLFDCARVVAEPSADLIDEILLLLIVSEANVRRMS
jgi:hypothetical protein